MEREPKKLITRIVEVAALLALASFLLRMAARWLAEIWIPLIIAGAIAVAVAIIIRHWRNRGAW